MVFPSFGIAQQPSPSAPPASPAPSERLRPELRPDGGATPVTSNRIVPGRDYRLGPGDLLEVQVAGRLDVTRHQVVVDVDGAVNVPPLGAVDIGGLTLVQAHRKLLERARALFRFVDVTVAVIAPRSFEVVLSGEVEKPGAVLTSAIRRLHEVILSAGGITPRGSLRRVRVTDKGRDREADLLRFELTGDLADNPFVEEGMTIHVPPRGPSVTLAGAVRRPGEYEIGPTGSLAELLALVGGPQESAAHSQARLTRVGADGRKETLTVDLDTALARPADVTLHPGDVLFVPSAAILQDVIEVRGAFVGTTESSKTTTAGKPTIVQRFELAHGERVRDVVTKAGGTAAFAELTLASVERSGEAGPRQKIPIDLRRLLVEKDESQNIVLQNGDVLSVPVAEDKVYVLGEVKTPGGVDFRPELTPREYVALAGGPGVRAKLRETTVTFRDGRSYPMKDAPPLEPGAVVTVPEVAVRWYQDYLSIAQTIASLITAYTGLYFIFNTKSGSGF